MARGSTLLRAVLALLLALGVLVGLQPAQADTTPTGEGEPATVSADPLPTVQIDGVVWTQQVVGNKVYAGGNFTSARPAGTEPGVGEVPRTHLLAYDIRTGALDSGFAPVFDGQVLALALSPDGSRLYVGGQFTRVNGFTRSRLAVFDTASGELLRNFIPIVGTTVRAVAATSDTVYVGGDFTTINGQARPFLGAVSAADGSTLGWAPQADDKVTALTLNPSGSKLIVGGRFFNVGGAPAIGLAALDPRSGQQLPWAVNQAVQDAGPYSAITGLAIDGDSVYGTGYSYAIGAAAANAYKGNFEGAFRVDGESGEITWLADCYGDHYSVWPQGDVVYTASHAHSCENVLDGFSDTNPRTYYSSGAFTKQVTGLATYNPLYAEKFPTSRAGVPSPSLLHWYPVWSVGAFTGQAQAGWHVTGNSDYLVYGGEFLAVNGKSQQGLVRFAKTDLAPNKIAPQRTDGLAPAAVSVRPGEVEVGWEATFDRDNREIRYELYRNNIEVSDRPIHVTTALSTPWRRPLLTYTDTNLPPGSTQTYRIFAFDSSGSNIGSAETSVEVAGAGSTYGRAIIASEPLHWFRLDDADGVQLADSRGSATAFSPAALIVDGLTGIAPDGPGATGDGGSAMEFDGSDQAYAVTETSQMGPQAFSVEAWVRTSSTTGGRIVGFSDTEVGFSRTGWTDRHLYLANDGRVFFGVTPDGTKKVIASPTAINDGAWHHVVGTLGPAGMALYVDGERVAANSSVTEARIMQGHWRIGADTIQYWSKWPEDSALAGTIDDVAIYPHAMTDAEIAGHYAAASGIEAPPPPPRGDQNIPPTAAFGPPAITDATVTVDGSGSSDPDGRITSYLWDFGDGSPVVSGAKQTHTFAASGTYKVRLTVSDDTGGTDTASRTVTVLAPNQLPTADFTASVTGLTAAFDAGSSTDPDGRIVDYAWDFGDGTQPGSGATPTHTFPDYGTYDVRLTITDDRGDTDEMTSQLGIWTTGLQSMMPMRLMDTRSTVRIPARGVLEVPVAGRAGIPADASAAALNVTVTQPVGPGYVTAYPCGTTPPLASNLNFVGGQTIPNAVLAGIGDGGAVCFTASTATHLVVDANGWFPAAASYTGMAPQRLIDTRTSAAIPAGGVLQVLVAGTAGVPGDASAAALNVTVTEPSTSGFVTAYPCGTPAPLASNLNFTRGQTIPNAVLAGIGSQGAVCFKASTATHLIVDVNGWFPADAEYRAFTPQRLIDTRASGPIGAGGVLQVEVAGRAGIPAGASAATLNVTVTQPGGSGYVTVYPCGTAAPLASNLNFTRGQTIPNAVLTGIGAGGAVCFKASTTTHLVVDANGWFPAS